MLRKATTLIITTLILSPLTHASSVASCSLNGNFARSPNTAKVCQTEICCDGGAGVGTYWMPGLPSSAATACAAPKAVAATAKMTTGAPSANCSPKDMDFASKMTLDDQVKKTSAAQGFPAGSAQCRFDKPCDSDGPAS